MQNSGISASTLAERIQAKAEQDRQTVENQTRQNFATLSESLRQSSQNALHTTEAAIQSELGKLEQSLASHCRIMSRAFGFKTLQALLLGLCLLLGMGLGSWGILHHLGAEITQAREDIHSLTASKTRLEATLAQLEAKTWGLELAETKEGRFIVFPIRSTPKTGWTVSNRPAVKVE